MLKPDFKAGGSDYHGIKKDETQADLEARLWIEAVKNGTEPITTPEQAYCVTRILEGIYESSKTGKPYYFD